MSNRKRLRKLGVADETPRSVKALLLIGVCSLIAITSGLFGSPHILSNFITSYREQYHLIVYGTSNYCSQYFNYKRLLSIVHGEIYGQESAFNELESILRQHENHTAIAIVGTTGVGKTYFMNLLRQNYPWKEDNIQHFVWSTYQDETDKFHRLVRFLGKLSDCGHNLILIDDLTPNDKSRILKYQALIERTIAENRSIKLIVIYVFNVLRYSAIGQSTYEENVKNLQNLDNIKTVNFKELNSFDVEQCVRSMAIDLKLRYNDKKIIEIVKTIDIFHFGCKNVHARIIKFVGSL